MGPILLLLLLGLLPHPIGDGANTPPTAAAEPESGADGLHGLCAGRLPYGRPDRAMRTTAQHWPADGRALLRHHPRRRRISFRRRLPLRRPPSSSVMSQFILLRFPLTLLLLLSITFTQNTCLHSPDDTKRGNYRPAVFGYYPTWCTALGVDGSGVFFGKETLLSPC
ncbi:UNVERIFIED_CONTAM: hypothetical protein Sradi_6849000 [Sesamum radiatum]|uniref:Uncharacterized protein n=1 Tax=Sesamum radiatum TaxID=300843 RepID=A0AAW2JL60_SESRA